MSPLDDLDERINSLTAELDGLLAERKIGKTSNDLDELLSNRARLQARYRGLLADINRSIRAKRMRLRRLKFPVTRE